jgi:hypothetical protein
MEIFLIYILPILINAFGIFGAWCTEPEGKVGMILTFVFMFVPGLNLIPALLYLLIAGYMMFEPARMFKKCTNFWKFLFGENSIY